MYCTYCQTSNIITAILFVIFNAQFLYLVDIFTDFSGNGGCEYVHGNPEYLRILFSVIIAILYSFGPYVIMIIANVAIAYKFLMAKIQSRGGGTESTNQALSKSAMKGTAMLLTVSFAFIILTGPIAFANAMWEIIPAVIFEITIMLQYLNHGVNCVLYCISGSRFRNELLKTFRCFKKSPSRTTSTTATNFTAESEVNFTATPMQ